MSIALASLGDRGGGGKYAVPEGGVTREITGSAQPRALLCGRVVVRTVRVFGASLGGLAAELVEVEARFQKGDTGRTELVLTGLPDPVLRESRARVESALLANGLHLPSGRVHLNLVPAARRKRGESLDLALALGVASAVGHLEPRRLKDTLFLGELGIDGRLHPVVGGLAAALVARERGLARLVAPPRTAAEAACLEAPETLVARHLAQVLEHFSGPGATRALERAARPAEEGEAGAERPGPSLDSIRGLVLAKEALAVAAAGGHGLLLVGPPGAGKSLLARALVRLLPPPALEERLEITRVSSAAGMWPAGLARERPFRAPHHTVSAAGLVGGGPRLEPGETTLAHRGLLFLDELCEFRRDVLEALRQPLESGEVEVSRATGKVCFPARFQLVCATNPCPCGFLGHPLRPCRCPPGAVARYLARLSGPLLDRLELRLTVRAASAEELVAPAPPAEGASERTLTQRVARAAALARERQGVQRNAELGADELERFAPLDSECRRLLSRAAARRALSARGLLALRRVARTLADLDGEPAPRAEHLARALCLREPLLGASDRGTQGSGSVSRLERA